MQLARVAVLVLFACSKKSAAPEDKPPAKERVPLGCPSGTAEKHKPWRQQVSPGSTYTEGEQAWCERSDGTRHGPLRITYMSGKRAVEGAYENGAREGAWTVWYGEGPKATEETWRLGKRHGAWRSFGRDGKPWGEATFDDGKLTTWIEYDEHGNKRVVDKQPELKPIDE